VSTGRFRRSAGKARTPEIRHRKRRLSERFFVPPYVGHRGWLGARLDRGLNWDELAGIAEEAYAEVAPAKLVEAAQRKTSLIADRRPRE
jgi:predicted DNA-binding protein (MmcQ/YjbR family)